MANDSPDDVTRLLLAWNDGDPLAAETLMPIIYGRLRAMAYEYMRRERGGHTLQPTALVHEAYLRLVDKTSVQWQGRAHFYHLAARAMRRILVDHARARLTQRRGGRQERVPLEAAEAVAQSDGTPEPDLIALDAALARLAQGYPRPGQIVELRFFGGLEIQAIAEILQVSERTVKRDWQFAKLWLHREIGDALDGYGR